MELCVLNSGSSGNCTFIASGGTAVLIDAGISRTAIQKRLADLGRDLGQIAAILFTHEHTDHCWALPMVAARYPGLALYANEGTASSIDLALEPDLRKRNLPPFDWNIFETGSAFEIGDLSIESFPIEHDAGEPVGYCISDGHARVAVATDLGTVTEVVRRHLAGCDALVLESNHDVEMLKASDRPPHLVQRIAGRHGHLSNYAAGDLLASVADERLRFVLPAHLSGDCNRPELAESAFRSALRALHLERRVEIVPTFRDAPSRLLSL